MPNDQESLALPEPTEMTPQQFRDAALEPEFPEKHTGSLAEKTATRLVAGRPLPVQEVIKMVAREAAHRAGDDKCAYRVEVEERTIRILATLDRSLQDEKMPLPVRIAVMMQGLDGGLEAVGAAVMTAMRLPSARVQAQAEKPKSKREPVDLSTFRKPVNGEPTT